MRIQRIRKIYILACNAYNALFQMNQWSMPLCSEVWNSLRFLFGNIIVRYGDAIYRKVIYTLCTTWVVLYSTGNY